MIMADLCNELQPRGGPYASSMTPRRRSRTALLTLPLVLAVLACAPQQEAVSDGTPDGGTDDGSTATPESCALDALPLQTDGRLTVATDSPAYDPWFVDNDPTNGRGYESAVAYAVADELGFAAEDVDWVKVGFNSSYAPGPKSFDFDINQISITAAREKAVDFSQGYYAAAQAVIALKGTAGAEATSLSDLSDLRLGAQTGTTSLTAIRDLIQPAAEPLVFDDTNVAKQALANDQVDAILADLPTAFYISAVEIPDSSIVGQFQPASGEQEEFGMLFEQGSGLVPCVDDALETLSEDGTLADLEQQWLSESVSVPELQ